MHIRQRNRQAGNSRDGYDSAAAADATRDEAPRRMPGGDETPTPPRWTSPIARKGVIFRRYSGLVTTAPQAQGLAGVGWDRQWRLRSD